MKYVMLAMALMAGGARAAEPVEGVFFAEAGCVAYLSKNSGSNPGDVRLEPGRSYEALQLNAPGGEWVQVRVPGAARSEARWVSLDCGRLSERMDAVLANIAQAVAGGGEAPALMTGNGKNDVHLLVVATADRGLCGGFNSQIARLARDHVRRLVAEGKKVKISGKAKSKEGANGKPWHMIVYVKSIEEVAAE